MRYSALLSLVLTVVLAAADKIPQRMQEFVDAGTMAGAVTLVQHKGKVVSLDAVGYQDLATKTPMRTDSIFQIMSMTKPVTCSGILILMEEGRLSLLDPVSRHLPEFRYQKLRQGARGDGSVTLVEPAREITIRDLMTHTSGLPPSPGRGGEDLYRTFDKTLAEVVAMAARQPLNFEPGSQWQYSNMGLATLGRIIEVVSGQSYSEFIEARIFQPLGMKDSFFYLPEDRHSRLASVYTLTDGKLVKTTADIFRTGSKYPMPEGGMYSTATDMAAFYQMLLDGGREILSPASVKLMTTNHTGELKAGFQPGIGYGLGVFVVREPLGEFRLQSIGSFGHGGAYRTYNWADPSKDLVGIFMTQRTNGGGDMAEEISAFVQMAASAVSRSAE